MHSYLYHSVNIYHYLNMYLISSASLSTSWEQGPQCNSSVYPQEMNRVITIMHSYWGLICVKYSLFGSLMLLSDPMSKVVVLLPVCRKNKNKKPLVSAGSATGWNHIASWELELGFETRLSNSRTHLLTFVFKCSGLDLNLAFGSGDSFYYFCHNKPVYLNQEMERVLAGS